MSITSRRNILRNAAALAGGALIARPLAFGAKSAATKEPLKMGSDLQLFVDDYFIEKLDGVSLRMHTPQSAGPVYKFNEPWEGNVSFYTTVIRDGDKFRMYYRGWNLPEYSSPEKLSPGEVLHPKNDESVCYLESSDGIHWIRPELGLFDFRGSKKNNIIHQGEGKHNFAPFLDTNPAASPGARFKAVGGSGKLFAYHSADGIRWERTREQAVITDGAFDSQNIAFYDNRRGRYVSIYRDFRQGVRTIKYAESQDFLNWTPGIWADYGDAPAEQLYTNATVPYFRAPQVYLSFPKRFVPWLEPLGSVPGKGVSDTVFMTSRDGIQWNRHFMEAFIRPGRDPRNWVHRTNMVASGVHQTAPDEISLYVHRHYNYPSAYLERMTLRLDGFVSVHGDHHGGVFTTKPFLLEGTNMVLNFATSAAGTLRYEVIDANGNPLPGLGFEQTPPLYGDDIARKIAVQPAKRNERSALAASPLRLRFRLRDADLYSVKFED